MRVDHDISLLIPEIWCRFLPEERDPQFLISEGHLEPLHDFDHAGQRVFASRLGYRVTAKFSRTFLVRILDHPARVFLELLLASNWYQERLVAKQRSDVSLWTRHSHYVDDYLTNHAQGWLENLSEVER